MNSDWPTGRRLTARDEDFRGDPDAVYDRLRAGAPAFDDADYGRTLLTRYRDVRAVLRHKSLSVDARRTLADSYLRRIAGTGVNESTGDTAYEPPLVLLDDPAHRRIRSLVSKAFNPRTVAAMRPRVEAITAELLDALAGRERADLIQDFAGPLPTRVILEMMGMADADWASFKTWSEDVLRGYDPERDAVQQQRLRDGYVGMGREFRRVVAERRASPRNDLISEMVRAQELDDRLSDLEIISLCTQLMVAGNVTTTDLIGNGMHALLSHPEQHARLLRAPELVDSAVEEMLRYDCPITETARVTLAEENVAGRRLGPGATMTASLAAANHDPERFPDPHEFDIERRDNAHLGFGSGVHVCLGAPLARMESQIAVRELLRRFPGARLDPDAVPVRRDLPFFRGFTTLPILL